MQEIMYQVKKQYVLLISLFVALFIFFIGPQMAYGDVAPHPKTTQVVSLSKILEKPEGWLGVPVKIPLRFAWISEIYVPFRTLFTSDQYMNFTAWDIQSPIWEKDGFENLHAYFYMERDNKKLKDLINLKTFDTICVIGKVESLFGGRPFIRILWVCQLPGSLDVVNLKMLYKSMQSFKARKFDEAISGFQKILPTEPPEDIKSMIYKTTAKIYLYEKKSYEQAMQELYKARSCNPNDLELNELFVQCSNAMKHGTHPIPLIMTGKADSKFKTIAKPSEEKTETEIEETKETPKPKEAPKDAGKEAPKEPSEPY